MSYTRKDNEQFGGVVDKVVDALKAMYAAKTGGELELFVDRDSIGWGDDWRQAIRGSVERATVFLPIITQRYFQSTECCEELQAFYQSSDVLGVTELLLPVVLMGSSAIRSDDPREEVRIVERRNYKLIEQAWLAGYGSAEWRRAMNDLAEGLIAALEAAQARLLARVGEEVGDRSNLPRDEQAKAQPSVESDVAEMLESLEALQPKLDHSLLVSTVFADALKGALATPLTGLPPAEIRRRLVMIAERLRDPSAELEQAGTAVYGEIARFDALLRAMQDELTDPRLRAMVVSGLSAVGNPDDLNSARSALREGSDTVRSLGALSVAIRKSVGPAVNGINDLVKAIEIVLSWLTLSL